MKEQELRLRLFMEHLDLRPEEMPRDVAFLDAFQRHRLIVDDEQRIVTIPEDDAMLLEERLERMDHHVVHSLASNPGIFLSAAPSLR